MGKLKLNRNAKSLIEVIESEDGRITTIDNGKKHLTVEYTFDGVHHFSATLSYGSSPTDPRQLKNFRAQIRRKKAAIPT